jgi:hypothetical protein
VDKAFDYSKITAGFRKPRPSQKPHEVHANANEEERDASYALKTNEHQSSTHPTKQEGQR